MSEEKEYFTQFPNLTILPWLCWGLILGLTLAAVFYASRVYAEPRFVATAQDGGVTITLYDDPCELTDKVTNLPFKVTWQENGKTSQGCWGPRPDAQSVVAYFDDLTVALIPFGALHRAQGA